MKPIFASIPAIAAALALAACAGSATPPPTASQATLEPTSTPSELPPIGAPTGESATASGPEVFPTLNPITLQNASGLVEIAHLDAPGVRVVSISPVGNWLASAENEDNRIAVYDMPFTFGVTLLTGHQGPVNDLTWSPDGRLLASASDDGSVRLWDWGTSTETARIAVDQDGVASVAWSPDGRLIASGNRHGTLQLWDAQSGDELLHLQPGPDFADVSAIAWSPDSKQIAAATGLGVDTAGEIKVYDAITGADMPGLTNILASGPGSLAWAALKPLIGRVRFDGEAVLWNFDTSPEAAVMPAGGATDAIAFSPDSTMVVTGGFDHTVRVWDTLGTQLAVLQGHTDTIHTVDWPNDNTYIVSAGLDNVIRVWGVPNQ